MPSHNPGPGKKVSAYKPSKKYLGEILGVDLSQDDFDKAVNVRLLEVHSKLEARLRPDLRSIVSAEERSLSELWQNFRGNIITDDLFGPKITFNRRDDPSSFNRLVDFSKSLELLGADYIKSFCDISNHKSVAADFPEIPAWLKVGRALLGLSDVGQLPVADRKLILTQAEIRQLVSDLCAKKTAALKSSKTDNLTPGETRPTRKRRHQGHNKSPKTDNLTLGETRLTWKWMNKGHKQYGLKPGWEPAYPWSDYVSSSLFRMSQIYLSKIINMLDSRGKESPLNQSQKEELDILRSLHDGFYKQDQRDALLRKLINKYPPPQNPLRI